MDLRDVEDARMRSRSSSLSHPPAAQQALPTHLPPMQLGYAPGPVRPHPHARASMSPRLSVSPQLASHQPLPGPSSFYPPPQAQHMGSMVHLPPLAYHNHPPPLPPIALSPSSFQYQQPRSPSMTLPPLSAVASGFAPNPPRYMATAAMPPPPPMQRTASSASSSYVQPAAVVDDGAEAGPLTFRDPAGDTESDVELMPDVMEGKVPPEESSADMFEIPLLPCEWDGCRHAYWTVDALLNHLNRAHMPTTTGKGAPGEFACKWRDCTRFGRGQTSRHALQAHLRTHTAETPFHCAKPECDRSFNRSDALQKHMVSAHGEKLAPTRKPPTKTAGGSKKRKADAMLAEDGGDEEGGDDADASAMTIDDASVAEIASADITPSEAESPAMQALIEAALAQPGGPDNVTFARYICTAAKARYLAEQQAALQAELERETAIEHELRAEKDRLLDGVVRAELGDEFAESVKSVDPQSVQKLRWTYADRSSLAAIVPRDDGLPLLTSASAPPAPKAASSSKSRSKRRR